MDLELLALAGAAAEALVQAMVSDAWAGVRVKIARVMSGGDRQQVPGQEAELERSGQALRDGAIPASVVAGHWQGRIVELLTERPEYASEITKLLGDLQNGVAGAANVRIGGHNNGNVIIGDHNFARVRRSERP